VRRDAQAECGLFDNLQWATYHLSSRVILRKTTTMLQTLYRRCRSRALALCLCALAAMTASTAVLAATSQPSHDHPKFVELWRQATRPAGTTITEYPDFTMVKSKDGLTYYYFTKSNHFAHPGVVKRAMTRNPDGGWSQKIDGTSFAANRNDPGFLRWLEQFKELTRRMKQDIEATQGKSP
jgi:hypothetical protein